MLCHRTRPHLSAVARVSQQRFASQEIHPVLFRLQHEGDGPDIPLDRSHARLWSHQVVTPMTPWAMHQHHVPFSLQYLQLQSYLRGYLHHQPVLFSRPWLYRTVAGSMLRLFLYHRPQSRTLDDLRESSSESMNPLDMESIRVALERVLGLYQGPGTSGRCSSSRRETKVVLDLQVLPSPLLNADILAQYVGRCLAQGVAPPVIYDRLSEGVQPDVKKRASMPGAEGCPVAGFRLRIKGRVRGEEMASRFDYMKGSCPKRDQHALMDYGKCTMQLRSGSVGVKAWVHFQKPHREDATGRRQVLHQLGQGQGGRESSSLLLEKEEEKEIEQQLKNQKTKFQQQQLKETEETTSLLGEDMDYDPDRVKAYFKAREAASEQNKGLWNVQSSKDPLVRDLVLKLKQLHTPDHPAQSRFLW